MSNLPLFPGLPESQESLTQPPVSQTELRLSVPVRNQVEMVMRDLDSTLDPEHPARAIWALVERLDLSQLYDPIRAAADTPGRPATDPKVLLALWLYATVEGISSAHELDLLSQEHDAYRWLRGGVPLNYHLLSDFRGGHEEALDQLLTDLVAVLLKEDVVKLKRVAQDGVRVRASAGEGSFRGEKTLRGCLKQAQEQVERLAEEREHPDPLLNQREQAARERAARERGERVEEALRQLPEVQAVKERQKRHAGKKRAAKAGVAGAVQRNGALLGELAGIAEQVEQHLPDLGQIGVHGAKLIGAADFKGIGVLLDQRRNGGDHVLEHGGDVEGLQEEVHLAGFDLRQVENVVDQRQQMLAGGLNFLQVGNEVLLAQVFSLLVEHFAVADDGIQRGA